MEEKNNGGYSAENRESGYTAEGRRLRPRRPRISDKTYSTDDNRGRGRSYRDYDRDGNRGGSYDSYRQNRRDSYNSSEDGGHGERSYGRSDSGYSRGGYDRGGRSNFHSNYNRGDRDSSNESRYHSDDRRSSYGRSDRSSSRGSYSRDDDRRSSYGYSGRSSFQGNYSNDDNHRNSYGRSDRDSSRGSYSRDDSRRGGYGRGDSDSSHETRYYSNDRRSSYGSSDRSSSRGSYSRDDSRRGGYGRGDRDSSRGGYSHGNGGSRSNFKGGQKRSDYKFSPNSGIYKMIDNHQQISQVESDGIEETQSQTFQEEVRLNKFIANSGVCSRREADQMIQAGVVTVNGEVVTELGTKVNVVNDVVKFNGETLKGEKKVYIVMNKPANYVTTSSDPHAERTVMDLLKKCEYRVFPVGRLDKNTTGVLMFTNDGEMAEMLTHPSFDKKKIYQVMLDHDVTEEDREKILSGIELNDGPIKADDLQFIEEKDHRKMGIEIHSGKNRIVRRIFESLGYEVKALDRVFFAGLTKKGLKKGEWRYLTTAEANILRTGTYL